LDFDYFSPVYWPEFFIYKNRPTMPGRKNTFQKITNDETYAKQI